MVRKQVVCVQSYLYSLLMGVSHYDELHNVWITNANLEDLGAQWGAISKIYWLQKSTGRVSNVLGTYANDFKTCGERFHNVFKTNLNILDISNYFF